MSLSCPHCTKEIADESLERDYVKRTDIKKRFDEQAANAAKPHLEKIASLTTELQAAKGAALKLPEVQAQLDTLLDGDAFRRAGLGETANAAVLRMMHTNAVAAIAEAERPDFRSWLTSETGAKADPSTAPLLAAWAATPQTPAAAPGTPQAAPATPPRVAAAPPAQQNAAPPPTPRPTPNAAAAAVEVGSRQKQTPKQLNDEAAQIFDRYKAAKATDPKGAEEVYQRETAAWQAKMDAAKATPA